MKITKIIIISVLFLILLTIPALASDYNALADFGSDHGSPEQDGVVDFEDLMIFSQAYGSTPSDPNWNPACDICGQDSSDPDGQVDFEDLMPLADSFGEREEKEWTVMFYMGGDSDLESNMWDSLGSLESLVKNYPSEKVNILVQLDTKGNSNTYRYQITGVEKNLTRPYYPKDIKVILEEQKMDEAESLISFLKWAESYPAKRHFLIFDGHGYGCLDDPDDTRSVVTDDTSGEEKFLTTKEIIYSLSNSSQKIDILFFSACLMQMVEVAYDIGMGLPSNFPNYIIGSEEDSYNAMMDYEEMFKTVMTNPVTITLEDVCKSIIDNITNSWLGSIFRTRTLSVIDLPLFLTQAGGVMDDFALALKDSLYQFEISQAKKQTQSYGEEGEFKDLYDFAWNIYNIPSIDCKSEAQSVMGFVDAVIGDDFEFHDEGNHHGLSIYLPSDPEAYSTIYDDLQFARDTNWDEFIQRKDKVDNIETVAVTVYQSESVINAVKISWDTYAGATGYRIDRTIDGFNYETFETTETTYYDQDVQEGTGYIYYVSALGPFGTTLPSDVSIIEPKFLPACSLTSPPNDPDGLNPITNPTITFRWNPLNISCPYKNLDDIYGMVILYDITLGNEFVWGNTFKNDLYTDQTVFSGEGELIDGHKYKWFYEARGYEDYETNSEKILTISKSQEWEFTYKVGSSGPVHNLTKDTYYNTIQAALDDADSDNTIEVGDGTYDESITFPASKNIILQSVNGPSSTIIRGNDGSNTVTISNSPEGTTLEGFTITHESGNSGIGIYIYSGYLSINNSTISHNSHNISLLIEGCGIYNAGTGTLTITNSTISDNAAGANIGGIQSSGPLTITNSIVSNNTSDSGVGGITMAVSVYTSTIADSTISGNTGASVGGILINGTSSITNSTISDNIATNCFDNAAGIVNTSKLTITNSTISNNSGGSRSGGIYSTLNAQLIITGSTISNNTSCSAGGGIFNVGALTITNSTISDNSGTSDYACGIFLQASSGPNIIGGDNENDFNNFNEFINNYKTGDVPSSDRHIRNADGDCHMDYPYNYFTTGNNGTYDLRDIGPAGGYIFYDKGSYSDGWRYLEAAPASTEWTDKEWGSYGTVIGGTGTGIGTGQSNTTIIVTWLNNHSETDKAAQLCDALVYGGYGDWFLPSKDELNLMYTNLKIFGVGGFEYGHIYWSSSEYPADVAWWQSFYSGRQGYDFKNLIMQVRAVRAF